MAWMDDTYPQQWGSDEQSVQVIQQPAIQQPTTIFQQLPATMHTPVASVRPGHVKEDLVELMMIQNAQMHQVIMNNMTMSALSSFGYSQPHPPPQAVSRPVIVEEVEEDPEVYHHHYEPAFYPSYPPSWPPPVQPLPPLVYQPPTDRLEPVPVTSNHRRAVPPPPPPSATGTVGADIPPAAEYYDATERG